MVVITSIGNSGANGVYSAGAPGVGNEVIGVASFDNSHVSALTFVTPGGRGVPYLEITETTDAPTTGTSDSGRDRRSRLPEERADLGAPR